MAEGQNAIAALTQKLCGEIEAQINRNEATSQQLQKETQQLRDMLHNLRGGGIQPTSVPSQSLAAEKPVNGTWRERIAYILSKMPGHRATLDELAAAMRREGLAAKLNNAAIKGRCTSAFSSNQKFFTRVGPRTYAIRNGQSYETIRRATESAETASSRPTGQGTGTPAQRSALVKAREALRRKRLASANASSSTAHPKRRTRAVNSAPLSDLAYDNWPQGQNPLKVADIWRIVKAAGGQSTSSDGQKVMAQALNKDRRFRWVDRGTYEKVG